MTFCVAIRIRDGIVGLGDTQIVKGSERHSKGKLATIAHGDTHFFVMTSGLRSVRDKTVIYVENALRKHAADYDRLYKVANLFGRMLRLVREEDGPSLFASNLEFNSHIVIGGMLSDDLSPTLFYIYPEGNWIESSTDSPYFVVGRTPYAKPVLDRLLRYGMTLSDACALAVLAFDMTRSSVTDVDFPIDIIIVPATGCTALMHRFDAPEMRAAMQWWETRLTDSLHQFPMDWARPLAIHSI